MENPVNHDLTHVTHCCILHGCKYMDEDCPVLTKRMEQKYLCPDCDWDGIKDLENAKVLSMIPMSTPVYELCKILNKCDIKYRIIEQTYTGDRVGGFMIHIKDCAVFFDDDGEIFNG